MSSDDYTKARQATEPRDQFEQAFEAGVNPYAADYTGHTPAPTVKDRDPKVLIVSFGFLHGEPPSGQDCTFDLRDHFRDPHIDKRLKYMTADDQEVVDKVLGTEGVREFGEEFAAVLARVARRNDTTAALGCAVGRHRAPVISEYVAKILRRWGYRQPSGVSGGDTQPGGAR